jgi:hypothetical protein
MVALLCQADVKVAEKEYSSVNMDEVTVYAFSQVGVAGFDSQVLELKPDMNMRVWQRWRNWGVRPADYNFGSVEQYHQQHIAFVAGTTASAYYFDEAGSNTEYEKNVSRDARGRMVSHPMEFRRGTLASPAYRDYLVRIAKMQIDGGVDGLFFDEVNASYSGNEGFDDYHLADFNAYLLAKYPASTDWKTKFGMTEDNILHPELPPDDLQRNFNYRRYLASKNWADNPLTLENPLAKEWGTTIMNRPEPRMTNFVDYACMKIYWKDIVDRVREYAASKGRSILITSNGIFPYVDFQGVGLYEGNHDGLGGAEVDYVPGQDGHLDGKQSLLPVFKSLKARSLEMAGDVPVVFFLDWPCKIMDRYNALSLSERRDYWRIYAAEAYASGCFFAFHLHTVTGEPSATALGMMPLFKDLAAFYKKNGELFHQVRQAQEAATVQAANVSFNLMAKTDGSKMMLHCINHNYQQELVPVRNFSVSVGLERSPSLVRVVSPDKAANEEIPFTYNDGKITLQIGELAAYNIIVIEM